MGTEVPAEVTGARVTAGATGARVTAAEVATGRGRVGRAGVRPGQVERGPGRGGRRTVDGGEERGRLLVRVVGATVAFRGAVAGHLGTVADCSAVESSNAGTVTVETRST
ncbi:hypothetical protein GA0070622_0378 [Micromonospora sediminicola]|uniref:Uncharacterized protein n=1 Tax=Micromonospora sediminicola TaxID=946078 RepID=A0A1A9B3D3_9ACTN|nr:hypothetical protein GA0070622_0378 [Micromonospora sediminicola]